VNQLKEWRGDFGREYTDRNQPDWHDLVAGFRQMLPDRVESVLEVGCNRGHNMVALQHLLPGSVVQGVEPMAYARNLAVADGLDVSDGSVYALPFADETFDLVFTSGVLIHVPPDRLHEAMRELVRVSSRYVLAIEYGSATDEMIVYRGRTNMLWKRDYAQHYLLAVPDLEMMAAGKTGCDDWVLLEL
jgi:pseudaminic acid biosynthesis-associated methylase